MFILLLLIWFVFNGKITMEITVLGIILCACIYLFMCRFMGYSVRKDIALTKKSVYFLYYIVVLIAEIIKANIQVIHFVLDDREIVEPVIVEHRTRLKAGCTNAATRSPLSLLVMDSTGTRTFLHEGSQINSISPGFAKSCGKSLPLKTYPSVSLYSVVDLIGFTYSSKG